MRVSISYNWFGFKFHWTCFSGIYDTNWLGIASEQSKAGNDALPINLPTTFDDSSKSC